MKSLPSRKVREPGFRLATLALVLLILLVACPAFADTLAAQADFDARFNALRDKTHRAQQLREELDRLEARDPESEELKKKVQAYNKLYEELQKDAEALVPGFAHKLVSEAADFLESMDGAGDAQGKGYAWWANNVREYLRKGKFKLADFSDANAEQVPSLVGSDFIKLSRSKLKQALQSLAEGDPSSENGQVKRFRVVADWAASLYHEKIHAHQSLSYRCWDKASYESGATDNYVIEQTAHGDTIAAVDQWLDKMKIDAAKLPGTQAARRLHLRKMTRLCDIKDDRIDTFIKQRFGRRFKGAYEELRGQNSKLKAALLKKIKEGSSGPPRSGSGTPKGPLFGAVTDPVNPIGQEMARIESAIQMPRAPWEGEFIRRFEGHGRAAGHIFDVALTNKAAFPIEVMAPAGAVLECEDPRYQRMMLSKTVEATLEPGESEKVALYGYCLDPQRLPPPESEELAWGCPDETEQFEGLLAIIEAGEDLARSGEFARDIFPPEKYKTTVIQRAIWYERTKDEVEVWDKPRLSRDLMEQIDLVDKGHRPPPQEVQEVVDRIWDDVDLVRKKAQEGKSQTWRSWMTRALGAREPAAAARGGPAPA